MTGELLNVKQEDSSMIRREWIKIRRRKWAEREFGRGGGRGT